jgi:hypothetical protein
MQLNLKLLQFQGPIPSFEGLKGRDLTRFGDNQDPFKITVYREE